MVLLLMALSRLQFRDVCRCVCMGCSGRLHSCLPNLRGLLCCTYARLDKYHLWQGAVALFQVCLLPTCGSTETELCCALMASEPACLAARKACKKSSGSDPGALRGSWFGAGRAARRLLKPGQRLRIAKALKSDSLPGHWDFSLLLSVGWTHSLRTTPKDMPLASSEISLFTFSCR